jgi:hypothetical protein
MTTTRRAALTALASASALAIPAVAFAVQLNADAEIVALSAEIQRIRASGKELDANRIEPFQDTFETLIHDVRVPWEERSAAAFGYRHETGSDVAIEELEKLETHNDRLFNHMMAIPATTPAGRAAKVRALLVHVMRDDWLGPARDLDWPAQQARALLGEFAGMNEEELAAI